MPTDHGIGQSRPAITLDDLRHLTAEGRVSTVDVVFPDLHGRLAGKRLDAGFFLEHCVTAGISACDYLLITDIDLTPVDGYLVANWDRGFGDLLLVPDLATLRPAAWKNATAMVICNVFDGQHGAPTRVVPRTLLREERDRWTALGLSVLAASELEFYLFGDTYQAAFDKHYHRLTPSDRHLQDYHTGLVSHEDFHTDVRRSLVASGVPVEGTKGEWGIGQHELNLQAAEVLDMADRHTMLKHCVKDVASRHRLSATFMAKPEAHPAGSSGHLHVSVWMGDDNLCDRQAGTALRDEFRWILGGLLAFASDLMVFYAPTVNAYKRFQNASWAPTHLGWAHDNRTAAFRVVGHGGAARVECRIPGADCNPYLAYAAMLLSARMGLTERIEPADALRGSGYGSPGHPSIARSLREALESFRASALVRTALGDDVHAHYLRFFLHECEAFDAAVTDWERVRYFERI